MFWILFSIIPRMFTTRDCQYDHQGDGSSIHIYIWGKLGKRMCWNSRWKTHKVNLNVFVNIMKSVILKLVRKNVLIWYNNYDIIFIRCHCSCREREEHCDPQLHYYDSSECRCRCNNPRERSACIAAGKEWDDQSCSCACPRSTWRQCSTGYTFDYVNTCNCISTYLIAASGSLTGTFHEITL